MLSGLVEPLLPRASELDDDYVVDETVDDDQIGLLSSDKYVSRDCTSINPLPLKVGVEGQAFQPWGSKSFEKVEKDLVLFACLFACLFVCLFVCSLLSPSHSFFPQRYIALTLVNAPAIKFL